MKIPKRIKKRFQLRNLSIKDYVINILLRLRFGLIRIFWNSKLKNQSPVNKNKMQLTFEDDFDEVSWGNSGEDKKWIVGEHWGKYHPDRPNVHYGEPVNVENESHALFTVKHNPKIFKRDGEEILIPFEVSLLSTAKSFRQMYGRFECRMTLPKGRGVWPAFWMWGPTWPPEIDVIEAYGDYNGLDARYQYISVWWGRNSLGNKKSIGGWGIKVDTKKGVGKNYHEFAVEWKPDKMEFYTDGIKVFQYSNKKKLEEWYNQPDTNMWIIINNSLLDGFVNDNETDFYSEFKVDYIRTYQFI